MRDFNENDASNGVVEKIQKDKRNCWCQCSASVAQASSVLFHVHIKSGGTRFKINHFACNVKMQITFA